MDSELLGIGLFGVFGFLLFVVLLLCLEKASDDGIGNISFSMSEPGSFIKKLSRTITAERSALVVPFILRDFPFSQLEAATCKFARSNLIKSGHSGDLFSGLLEGGELVVIKKIQPSKSERDFYASEMDIYGKVSDQRFLVALLGQCVENEEKLLVYEYMPNGDLATALANARAAANSEEEVTPNAIPWKMRLEIARGVAEALAFLHHASKPRLAHRNIQGSSILLTEHFEVKLGSLSEAQKLEGKEVPAYDIYCFGKLLLDLVSGLDISGSKDEEVQAWMCKCFPIIGPQSKDQQFAEVVDKSMDLEEKEVKEVMEVALLAKACMDPITLQGLTMKDMFEMLKSL